MKAVWRLNAKCDPVGPEGDDLYEVKIPGCEPKDAHVGLVGMLISIMLGVQMERLR